MWELTETFGSFRRALRHTGTLDAGNLVEQRQTLTLDTGASLERRRTWTLDTVAPLRERLLATFLQLSLEAFKTKQKCVHVAACPCCLCLDMSTKNCE